MRAASALFPAPGRRRPTRLAWAGLALVLAGVVGYLLRPTPPDAPASMPEAPAAPMRHPAEPPAAVPAAAPAVAAAPLPKAAAPVLSAAPAPAVRPPGLPYRFMGRTGSGEEQALVLFGHGRVVSVRGPGRIDDEFVVEAVFDDYLVVRHTPSGVGTFLRTDRTPRADPSLASAQDAPQD